MLGGGAALGLAAATGSLGESTTTTIREAAPVQAAVAASSDGNGLSVNEIYRRSAPAVVQITSKTAPTTTTDPFFGYQT